MISPAVSSFTTTSPDSKADRLQSSDTSRRVSQMPVSSAMVSSVSVACEESAPAKPVTITLRPAPDRLSSRKAVR
ncbi:MAG: hypothetical protein ACD_54C00623G0001 [uncultured bacterium]|nr:MAG: hypothetical protein ACD_54C00623G0001 [uncultured bacterium]